ncbi:TPA: transporter substrate-binding domain-containing protein, partial [Klebsiella michiganensis]
AHWANAGVNVVTYQDQDQVFMDLSAGRLDGAVQESQTAQQAFLSKDEGKEFSFAGDSLKDPVTLGQGTGMGLRQKDTELQQQVNNALNEMKKDGTLLKLSTQYFNRNIIAE